MTLVQVSIADGGKCVILIADRLLTSRLSDDLPPYEFEAHTPKIIHNGNVGVGFAGSSLYADLATVNIGNKEDFDEIVEAISNFIKKEKRRNIDAFIKRLTGVESEDFFKNKELPIPDEVRNFIYGQLKTFEIGCHSIITGFDKNEVARIIVVDEQGECLETTTFSFLSIGSGSPFSRVYFDLYGYDKNMNVNEALLFAYEAKQWAQSHTGVGQKTDILIFQKDKKVLEINDGSELMVKMHNKYIEEYKRHHKIRSDLLGDILKN